MKNLFAIPSVVQELLSSSSQGMGPFINKLSHLLSLPVVVTDLLFQILSYSGGFVEDHDKIISIIELNKDPMSNIALCKITRNNEERIGLAATISYNKITFGHLIIIGNEDESVLYQYNQLLNYAASLCAIEMQKKHEIHKEKFKFKDSFLYDLLYGNLKQKVDIIEHGRMWNWDFTLPHQVLVFSLNDYNPFSSDKQKLDSIAHIIENSLIERSKTPIIMTKTNQIIVIFPWENIDHPTVKKELTNFILFIFDQIYIWMKTNTISCGIGKVYTDPSELFRSYQEAKVAYTLGILLGISIPFFSDLGLERILYKHDLHDLKEYYNHTLGELEKYDNDCKNELIETLEAFAANQFDITKTAKALFLHRNTLRYRLKRIEEILNIKLDNFNIKLNIFAAFKIKQLRKL